MSLRAILEGQMCEAYSPIVTLANMPAVASVNDVAPGEVVVVGGAKVRSHRVRATSGAAACFAYRIEDAGRSLVYVTDVDYERTPPDQALVDFARGADLLVHEAFYTEDERRRGVDRLVANSKSPDEGRHATFGEATALALRARVPRVLYCHHHPDRKDADVELAVENERRAIAAAGSSLVAETAREGLQVMV
jgi:ribonuclease BN (tRNA processing enzyme)